MDTIHRINCPAHPNEEITYLIALTNWHQLFVSITAKRICRCWKGIHSRVRHRRWSWIAQRDVSRLVVRCPSAFMHYACVGSWRSQEHSPCSTYVVICSFQLLFIVYSRLGRPSGSGIQFINASTNTSAPISSQRRWNPCWTSKCALLYGSLVGTDLQLLNRMRAKIRNIHQF